MAIYCPFCNASSDEKDFIDNICIDCYIKRNVREQDLNIEIYRCKSCGRVKYKDEFYKEDSAILKSIINSKLEKKGIKIIDIADDSFYAEISSFNSKAYTKLKIVLDYKQTICKRCSLMKSSYYEAIVQIRASVTTTEVIIKRLLRFVNLKGEFVSKIEYLKNGADVYVSSKKIMNEFFANHTKIKPQVSYKFSKYIDGKPFYKNIYLLRYDK
ncbi:MAG: NMD protein affecting ribosome stability and mRNA decay [Candidatus Micrarchaeota archaeon]|nr:MAG: NMD protein affecting ribosome stability and mRNA decay [Candidatus Micrarchaeota archaeon]